MNVTCIRDLAEVTGGRLKLGSLPPLGGELEPIGRVVVNCTHVNEGDVFWGLEDDGAHFADEAFARGALGVVAGRNIEPWAGKFSLQVSDPREDLRRFATGRANQVPSGMTCSARGGMKTSEVQSFASELREFDATLPPG